ncbi:MAG TPA: hypothetical protein VFA68_10895 [Terriglobales bacterium]|nr:hypothetical protein [Terriglobales bacterium]
MKFSIGRFLASLAAGVLLLATVAPAQVSEHAVKFAAPFEFTIGQRTFPAGSYSLVRTEPYLLELRDADKRSLTRVVTRSVQTLEAPEESKVLFYSENGRHLLGQVWLGRETLGQEIYRPKNGSVVASHRAPAEATIAVTK